MDDYKKEIRDGFKELREGLTEVSIVLAALTERVTNMQIDQMEVKKAMKELEETKTQVEANTKFRERVEGALSTVIKTVLTIATLAALYGLALYIVRVGF